MKLLLGMVVALVMWTGAASAQPAGNAPDKQKAILELMEIVGMSAMVQQMMDMSITMTFDLVRKKNPRLSEGDMKIVSDAFSQTVRETMPGILARFAVIYEEFFTLDEIRDINAFYRTTSGQKALKAMPQIMQRGMVVGQEWAAQTLPIVLDRVRSQMKQRGIELEL